MTNSIDLLKKADHAECVDLNNNSDKDVYVKPTANERKSPICSEIKEAKLVMPTFEEIKNAIPAQCFEKNLKLSVFYLVLDYAILAALFYVVPYVEASAGWMGLLVW